MRYAVVISALFLVGCAEAEYKMGLPNLCQGEESKDYTRQLYEESKSTCQRICKGRWSGLIRPMRRSIECMCPR